jgi:hypothetical protein
VAAEALDLAQDREKKAVAGARQKMKPELEKKGAQPVSLTFDELPEGFSF